MRESLAAWLREGFLPPEASLLCEAWAQGMDDDEACLVAGCTLEQLDYVRKELRHLLSTAGFDEPAQLELSPAEVARVSGLPLKKVYKRLQRGRITGRKRDRR